MGISAKSLAGFFAQGHMRKVNRFLVLRVKSLVCAQWCDIQPFVMSTNILQHSDEHQSVLNPQQQRDWYFISIIAQIRSELKSDIVVGHDSAHK